MLSTNEWHWGKKQVNGKEQWNQLLWQTLDTEHLGSFASCPSRTVLTLGRREETAEQPGSLFCFGWGWGWTSLGGLSGMTAFLISRLWCPLPFPTSEFLSIDYNYADELKNRKKLVCNWEPALGWSFNVMAHRLRKVENPWLRLIN